MTPGSDSAAFIDTRALLGAFASDLWFPAYRAVTTGPWSLRCVSMAGARGYWGKAHRIAGAAILSGPGREGRASWMSTTPSEIESQEIGLSAAHGHTVVVGLGMGWLAGNVALRPAVDRVTVIELDPDIIALVAALGVFDQLPPGARAKIEIVQGDALSWTPGGPVDSLQADIWERFVEDRKVEDIRRIQENIRANAVYFWGQEMEIWCEARRQRGAEMVLDWPLIRSIATERWNLPLILPDWPDYPEKIMEAAKWWTPADARLGA